MKNSEVIVNAQKALELVRRQGFTKAALQLMDDDDNVFSTVADYAYDYSEEGQSTLRVYLKLTDLEVDVSRDPEDEDADPVITYP